MILERRCAAIFIPFSRLRGIEGGCGLWYLPIQGSIGCNDRWRAFAITRHLVSPVAAVPKGYLLFSKDYAPIEQKIY
jgi:hypothetical protein